MSKTIENDISSELNDANVDNSENYDSDDASEKTDFSCDYEEILDGDDDEDYFELDEDNNNNEIRKGEDRVSLNRMTRYEFVRLVGERTKQLTLGAKSFIKNKNDFDYETIAIEEIKNKLIPLKIIRRLPNDIMEEWKIDELYVDHLF